MKALIRTIVVVLAIIGLASLLNPSAERHRAKIKEAVNERNQLAAALQLGDVAAFVSSYHSVGFASYTTFDDKVLSVGAFGVVVVMDKHKSVKSR